MFSTQHSMRINDVTFTCGRRFIDYVEERLKQRKFGYLSEWNEENPN